MKTKDRPLETHTAVINSFLDYAEVPEEEKELLKKELKRYIETRIRKGKWCHPCITKFHTDWYREFYNLIDKDDPYKELKEKSNEQAKELLEKFEFKDIKDIIMLTIIGNKIDFGACVHGIYSLEQLEEDVKNIKNEKLFIDDTDELIERIKTAKNIFFLFDNDGEMIFDTLLLDYIVKFVDPKNIYLVAKETPLLNDVTVEDLRNNDMKRYGTIVSTGSNCFGLHEEDVSSEFKQLFKTADLVIAKGQAYFEFFTEYNFTNVFNILRIKQEVCGDNIPTLKPGMNIVMNSKQYAGKGIDYPF